MADDTLPFGWKQHPDLPAVRVKFKTRGYPFRLRREWQEATDAKTLDIVLRYVEEWTLPDMDGVPLPLPPVDERKAPVMMVNKVPVLLSPPVFDRVEDAIVVWLIRTFAQFWRWELTQPRPNSSPPSPATSADTAEAPTN